VRSLGFSNYHSMQWNLRKRFSDGFQFDLNYTLSRPDVCRVERLKSRERVVEQVRSAAAADQRGVLVVGLVGNRSHTVLGLAPAVLAATGTLMWWNRVAGKGYWRWRQSLQAAKPRE
jgi:hypothetical protein